MKNIVFAGTPDFSAYHLQTLIDHGLTPTLVLTQPDRAAGRGRKYLPPPVKVVAEKYHIPVFQPEKLDSDAKAYLNELPQPDLLIVVAYGLLLPKNILSWAKLGAINVHASLLPRWRGAAPIQRAIEAGDSESGVGIMQMDSGLDTGAVWEEVRVPITDSMTAQHLHDKLRNLGAKTLIDTLPSIFNGDISPIKQSADGIVYAKKLSKAEAKVDWGETADTICRKIRAFNSMTVAHSETTEGVRFRFFAALPKTINHNQPNGSVLSEDKNGIVIVCQDGAICVTELQEVGKKRLFVSNYLNGNSLTRVKFV